jgi:CRISPR/Cas system-associated endonuclease Cas1
MLNPFRLFRRTPDRMMPDIKDAPVFCAEAKLPLHVLSDDAELQIDEWPLAVEGTGSSENFRLDALSLVALHGGSRVTVPCLHALVRAGVPLILLSRGGYYLGQILDVSGQHAVLLRCGHAAR